MRILPVGLTIVALYTTGCATMPNVKAHYYFPQAETKLVVTQTLGCSIDQKYMVAATDALATTTYSANYDTVGEFSYAGFGGQFEDSDVALTFTQDGRLSGINSTQTGEAATIIKDVVSLASAAAIVAFTVSDKGISPTIISDDCAQIAAFAGAKAGGDPKATNTVTLTYTINFLYGPNADQIAADPSSNTASYAQGLFKCITLIPDPDSQTIYSKLKAITDKQEVCAEKPVVSDVTGIADSIAWEKRQPAPSGYGYLQLNHVAIASIVALGPKGDFSGNTSIWRGNVAVPLQTYYALLVPTGVVFGKQQFTLALSDPGSITKLEYSTNTGAPSVIEAGTAAVSALPTTAKLAAEKQAQADLIYQQQRLVTCKANPTNCSGK